MQLEMWREFESSPLLRYLPACNDFWLPITVPGHEHGYIKFTLSYKCTSLLRKRIKEENIAKAGHRYDPPWDHP